MKRMKGDRGSFLTPPDRETDGLETPPRAAWSTRRVDMDEDLRGETGAQQLCWNPKTSV